MTGSDALLTACDGCWSPWLPPSSLALVLGAVAVRQRAQPRIGGGPPTSSAKPSQVALLGAQARELVDDQLDLASLLAVEAHRRSDGADAVDALADVLRAQPPIDRFIPFATVDLDGMEVGADGRRGAGLDGDQLVRFTLPDMTIEPAITIPGARSLAMSPDSSRIAVVTLDGLLIVDAVTGTDRDRPGHTEAFQVSRSETGHLDRAVAAGPPLGVGCERRRHHQRLRRSGRVDERAGTDRCDRVRSRGPTHRRGFRACRGERVHRPNRRFKSSTRGPAN